MLQTLRRDSVSEIAAFGASVREFLLRSSPLQRLREQRAKSPRFDRAMWERIAAEGWTAVLVPEDPGGLALDLRYVAAIGVEIGRRPIPEPVLAVAVQTVTTLVNSPPSGLRDDLLRSIASGKMVIGTAWQERLGELDCSAVPAATARRRPDGVVLQGRKRWVTPGRGADGWLVWADGDTGPGLYFAPSQALAANAVADEDRVDGASMSTLILDGVNIPEANLLATGDAAKLALERANDATRLVQAAELVGIARQALEITAEHLRSRTQFERPIGANQALQHRLVDAFVQLELAEAALEDCLRSAAADPPRLAAAASRAKARCAHAALEITRLAVHFHGAMGITDECDIGLYLKRALQHTSWLGGVSPLRRRYFACGGDAVGQRQDECAHEDDAAPGGDVDWNALPEQQFRSYVRAFVRRHYPANLRHSPRRLRWCEIKDWYLALSRQGWIAPAWPKEFGGMGLSAEKLLAFNDEMEAYGVARTPDQGLINLGPILIRYGTEEQKREYLPKIISGEHVWCQGYSEPNAGSDLASLRTEATLDGEHFIVNGQKIWTTLAHDASHIFLLVRTDKSVKKQAGISFLLAELAAPGVTVRPIRNLAGHEEFCEVFFDNVKVPRNNLVGRLNEGWTIAKALLGFERIFVGSPRAAQHALGLLRNLGESRGLFADTCFAERFEGLELDVADLRACYAKYADVLRRGDELPDSVSVLKICATETYFRIAVALFDACEEAGGAAGYDASQTEPFAVLLEAAITRIYAGSNEIQRNIIAKRVLNLPS